METKFTNDVEEAHLSYFLPSNLTISITKGREEERYLFRLEIRHYITRNVKQLTFHLVSTQHLSSIIQEILENIEHFKERAKEVKVTPTPSAEFIGGNKEIKFSDTIYFYTQKDLSELEMANLGGYLRDKDFLVRVRGPKYMDDLKEQKRKSTFISHDSKDKDLIAEPLANGLEARGCPVWFNSFELGENMLQAIERGIKESSKCILVITPNFLSNIRYARREFEAIISKEMIKKERIILPIWCGVTEDNVGEYSLSLAGLYAYQWPSRDTSDADKYQQEVNELITKLSNHLKKEISLFVD